MKYPVLLLLLVLQIHTHSQTTILVEKIPANTPENAKIYITGSFNGWNPADTAYLLKKSRMGYYIQFNEIPPKTEFKFTLGSWQTVETNIDGTDIQNRTIKHVNRTQKMNIENWKNSIIEIQNTATTNVKILYDSIYIPQLNTKRRIWIYLPPNYDQPDTRFPVLYMHDGQNLFNAATSFSGEWQVDEQLNTLFSTTQKSFIVIGIDNGGSERINELSPWLNDKYGGGKGELYAEFIVSILKPAIDSSYKTLSDAQNTAIIGSSLGGLISMYMVCKYPDVFGKAGIFSPAFWINPQIFEYVKNANLTANHRFYILAGGKESAFLYSEVKKMNSLLLDNRTNVPLVLVKKVANGKHNETFWSKHFIESVKYLWDF